MERQIEEFLDEDDDKENILRRVKPIRQRNGRTQGGEETDFGDCISNRQKWKRRKLIEGNKSDEEHHIPDTLEQQIEKWMDNNEYIILKETATKRSSKDNTTHATHTKEPEEPKREKFPANTQNFLNIKKQQPQTNETNQQEKTPQEVEEAEECGEKENGEDNTGNEEGSNLKNKEQGRTTVNKNKHDISQVEQVARKTHTTGKRLGSSNTTRIRRNWNAE